MLELVFVALLGGASVIAGIRGLVRGRLRLTPPRGVAASLEDRELTGRKAVVGSLAAIVVGCCVILLGVVRYRSM